MSKKTKITNLGEWREAIVERYLTCPECDNQMFAICLDEGIICVDCNAIIEMVKGTGPDVIIFPKHRDIK